MKRFTGFILAAVLFWLVSGCGRTVDLEAEKIELLRIHLADMQAHVAGDVPTLTGTMGEEFINVGDGRVSRQSRDQVREFFTGYLAGASYEKYQDLMVPHAEVSADGSMGWVVSQIAVTRTEPDGETGSRTRSFIYAGIMTYEKDGSKWVKTANVSTFAK